MSWPKSKDLWKTQLPLALFWTRDPSVESPLTKIPDEDVLFLTALYPTTLIGEPTIVEDNRQNS